MPTSIDAIIDRQFQRWERERSAAPVGAALAEPAGAHPLITVSREHGSVGSAVAASLADRFGCALFDGDVLDRLCAAPGHARRLLDSLDEPARARMETWWESMAGGLPFDERDGVRALLTTLYSIARLGGVVIVGRGANFVIGRERGFHVRIVAPREERIRAIAQRRGVSLREAAREVGQVDHERSKFVRRLFHRPVDDPLAYDLVVNTSATSPRIVADWLTEAAKQKFERQRPLQVSA